MDQNTEPLTTRQVLATAARLAVPAAGEVNPLSWSWQVYGDSLDLRIERARRSGGSRPAGRLASIACGVALQRAQVVFAALGARAAVRLDSDPEHASASITWIGRHSVTAHDIAMFQALSGEAESPSGSDLTPDGIEVLLSRAVRPFGVTTFRFDDTINRFLDANAVRPPRSAYRDLALVTNGDTADDWLHAGQALGAALLAASAAGLTATVHSLAETAGVRTLLRSLVAPAGQPQVLIRVAADGGQP
jgi:hypothetical protein